eukprot:13672062-Ditylum_brightwellii.AAC.1
MPSAKISSLPSSGSWTQEGGGKKGAVGRQHQAEQAGDPKPHGDSRALPWSLRHLLRGAG